jgi:hypothetical protein
MRLLSAFLFTAIVFTGVGAYAQGDKKQQKNKKEADAGDDLMAMLENEGGQKSKEYTTATFKSTRVINGHSIENTAKGVLDFRVSHRFGELKSVDNFFGLDNASTSIGLDYGLTNDVMIGINRSTFDKEFQVFTKLKLLRQTDTKDMPVSVSYMGAVSVHARKQPDPLPVGQTFYFTNRLTYVNQLIIARKFSSKFSLQLMPTHIHYNIVPTIAEPNDMFALGIGGRLKMSNRISLTGEYYYRFNELNGYFNSASIGIDIETGGHVFQLMVTNATSMNERAFIGQTSSDIADGDLHFGFNISRVFTVVRPKDFEGSRNKIW